MSEKKKQVFFPFDIESILTVAKTLSFIAMAKISMKKKINSIDMLCFYFARVIYIVRRNNQ